MAQLIFSKRSRKTFLSNINPLAKLFLMITFSSLVIENNAYVFFAGAASITLTMIIIRLPIISYMKKSKGLAFLLILIFLTEIFVSKNVIKAFYEALKFFFLIATSAILLDTTSANEIASSLGGMLSHVIGRSAWTFSSYVMLSISFISRIFTRSSDMMDARKSRLYSFFSNPIRNITEYVSSLILYLFDDLRLYYLSLESRLYDDTVERIRKDYRASDYALIILSLIVIVWINVF